VGCVLAIDPTLTDDDAWFFEQYWWVEIDPMPPMQWLGGDCSMSELFVLDLPQKTLTLCPDACMLFESAGTLLTGWAVACE
jgi:hypothetical protein